MCNGTFSGAGLQLQGLGLSGTIPPELSNLTVVSGGPLASGGFTLNLQGNSLSGTIPPELAGLGAGSGVPISYFELYDNRLSGTLPTQFGAFGARLVGDFTLVNNKISGTIPYQYGALTALASSFQLYNNSLSGTIPSQLGKLTGINATAAAALGGSGFNGIFLHQNLLSGSVPSQLGRLAATYCFLTAAQCTHAMLANCGSEDTNFFDCPLPTLDNSCGAGLSTCALHSPPPPSLPPSPPHGGTLCTYEPLCDGTCLYRDPNSHSPGPRAAAVLPPAQPMRSRG